MRTSHVFLLLLVALASGGCGGGGGGAGGGGAGDVEPPAITDARVSPALVVPGGTVYGSATVSDNLGVSKVRLLVQGTSAQGELSASGSGTYSGSLVLPTGIAGGVYPAVIEATDTAGNVSESTVASVAIENPPLPP